MKNKNIEYKETIEYKMKLLNTKWKCCMKYKIIAYK
jgi:hypothetical protein